MTDKKNQQSTFDPLEATPDVVVAQLEAAAIDYYKQEHLDRAAGHLQKLVKMRPHNVDYWALLGVVYRRQGKQAAGLQALKQAVLVDETDKNALVNLGEVLIEVGKVPEGVALLREVFEQGYDPGKPALEQDYFTKRAGAELAVVKTVIEGYVESKRAAD